MPAERVGREAKILRLHSAEKMRTRKAAVIFIFITVTLDMLAAVLTPMSVSLAEFFRPFTQVHKPPRTPRQRE